MRSLPRCSVSFSSYCLFVPSLDPLDRLVFIVRIQVYLTSPFLERSKLTSHPNLARIIDRLAVTMPPHYC